MNFIRKSQLLGVAIVFSFSLANTGHAATKERTRKVINHWNKERIEQAQPRNFVIDERGHSYLKGANGKKRLYGRSARAESRIIPNFGRRPPGGGGRISPGTIKNASWGFGGDVQTAAGRILFEMDNTAFICSETVATDGTSGRSVIVTAAHCVYDDENKEFATNIMFIPNQDETTGNRTDENCDNDPLGCWVPEFAVVDLNWTRNEFPDNIAWDYAYLVVADSGSHAGNGDDEVLDSVTDSLPIDFLPPYVADGDRGAGSLDFTHALGYSGTADPNFMYCAEDMGTFGVDNWWLRSCGLSGGSSGGPWVQPMDEATGSGEIVSVNSWGFDNGRPGMAGPVLNGTSAQCLFDEAKVASLDSNGVVVNSNTCP